ncbi:MAG: alpha/beta hydrolase [Bacteroidetes bacterium]|nr:alpha/beta hydrolase [Bacteroidota bacterium]
MRKAIRIISYVIMISVVILALAVFMPRTYDVPSPGKRESTRYWNLPAGSRIAYTLIPAVGKKKPYPVIFLQGGPGGPIYDKNISTFAPLAADGYDVYLYDQIGCGFSDRLDHVSDYTADRHKRDLEEIVKKIGAEKVIFIAQSWGAILSTLYIADNPDKVAKVIFTGPGPIQPKQAQTVLSKAPDSLHLRPPVFNNRDANGKTQNIRTRAVAQCATLFGIKLASDEEMDAFQTYLNGQLSKAIVCDTSKAPQAAAGGGFYAQVMTVYSFHELTDPRPKLKGLPIPVMIMKGQCDNQKWDDTQEYLGLFPDHQLVIIPGAGHSISVEQPELYLRTIRQFLN